MKIAFRNHQMEIKIWQFLKIIAFSTFIIFFFYNIYKVYNQKFAAFGCFDECFNYTAGYFMLKGRYLYENIFFNHQPLMAYLSYLIQLISDPGSIYQLVLYHKMFIVFFAFSMDIFLIVRFRLAGIAFVLLYESTKFYFMGNFFLAESLIVYPLVYMLGLIYLKFVNKRILSTDIIISGFCAWFIIFMREPYILAALIMYILILLGRKMFYSKLVSLSIFIFLSFLVLSFLNINEYISQVVWYNFSNIIQSELKSSQVSGMGLLKIFLYPISILTEGRWTFLRNILIGIDLIFLLSIIAIYIKTKKIFIFILFFMILGFTNIRVISPGLMFYEAFHMIPWYGLFLMSTFLFLKQLWQYKDMQKIGYALSLFAMIVFAYALFSPNSFMQEKTDREKEYLQNFGHYYVFGEAIRLLSEQGDTVFVERGDDLIYWQTKLDSSYKYAISSGHGVGKFDLERDDMFRNNPPDFYYYYLCSGKESGAPKVLNYKEHDYVAINYLEKPCLYIKKSKLASITPGMKDKLNVLRFYVPE